MAIEISRLRATLTTHGHIRKKKNIEKKKRTRGVMMPYQRLTAGNDVQESRPRPYAECHHTTVVLLLIAAGEYMALGSFVGSSHS